MAAPTAPVFLLIIFTTIISSFHFTYSTQNNGILCPETEKQALLAFKRSSWKDQVDCCMWEGVVCNNLTGHVHQLHLQYSDLTGKLNPSLLNLTHLTYLDLSDNYFEGEIPSFIGSFPKLECLNLSYSGFNGTIPHTIGNLSNLRTLNLQTNYGLLLNVDSLEWLSGVSQLEHLYMNNVNLNKANNWLQVINTLPSLVELQFHNCSLEGYIPSAGKTTKLQYLDISDNNFNSTIPEWLYNCKNLEHVNMRSNTLRGSISKALGNLTFLRTIDLSFNELSGEIPSELANLRSLEALYLSHNQLSGNFSDQFGELKSLETLDLSQNSLSGPIPNQLGNLASLRELRLAANRFTGPIPISLGNITSLTELRLDANRFTGNLPESLGQLSNLEYVYVGNNMLEGIVSESHFVNLTKLSVFSAPGNHLTLKVAPKWTPPFNLSILRLGSWNLGEDGQIPRWLDTQKNYIGELDLSNTGLNSNHVPKWIWEIGVYLNLSHNQLHGNIPDIINGPMLIYLSSNRFNGSLPKISSMVLVLDLSNNSFSTGIFNFLCDMTTETNKLCYLHLGENRLSGKLPDCWMRWPMLVYLNLGNNNLSGSIPTSFGLLTSLQSLNLQNNSLSGEISSSMQQCNKLVKIDLAGNKFVGNIPSWMGMSLYNLRILILRSNKFTGNISANLCHLNSLQILDLSDNIISGVIPKCVHNFTAMVRSLEQYSHWYVAQEGVFTIIPIDYAEQYFEESAIVSMKGNELEYDNILYLVTNINLSGNNLSGEIPNQLTSLVNLRSLNLSRNHLTGLIPNAIGEMEQLESVDLSRNSLSGEIPNSLGVISFLNYLDLSYNKLTGSIPQSTQIMTLDASGFIGNNLCGPPLPKSCSNVGETPASRDKENGGVGKYEVDWLYVFMSLGYAVGISAFFATLILNKSLRDAYFGLLEDMWDKYVSKK